MRRLMILSLFLAALACDGSEREDPKALKQLYQLGCNSNDECADDNVCRSEAGGNTCLPPCEGSEACMLPEGGTGFCTEGACVPACEDSCPGELTCVSGRCTVATVGEDLCGDGNMDPGEDCDDGNKVSGDGCSASCTGEVGRFAWQGSSIHFEMIGQRGEDPLRGDVTDPSSITCINDRAGLGYDIDVTGDFAPGIGHVTLKFKDADLLMATPPQTFAAPTEVRVEIEWKDGPPPANTTLCEHSNNLPGTVEIELADTDMLGGLVDVQLPDEGVCPPGNMQISFTVQCTAP